MAPQAPNQVPRISIPSSPMLTTPARSENRPPSPASMMGTAQRSMACDDVTAVSRSVSSKPCTTVSTATPTAA